MRLDSSRWLRLLETAILAYLRPPFLQYKLLATANFPGITPQKLSFFLVRFLSQFSRPYKYQSLLLYSVFFLFRPEAFV